MDAKTARDTVLHTFDELKAKYIREGMSAADADDLAYKEIKRAIWNTRPGQAW